MSSTLGERPDWVSFNRLVQEVLAGGTKRHTFTAWEMEFLLDLQALNLRKAGRDGALRRYLKAVQYHLSQPGIAVPKLREYLAKEAAATAGH